MDLSAQRSSSVIIAALIVFFRGLFRGIWNETDSSHYDISLIAADFMNSRQAHIIKGHGVETSKYPENPFEQEKHFDTKSDSYQRYMKTALKVAEQYRNLLGKPLRIALPEHERIRNRYKIQLNILVRLDVNDLAPDDWEADEGESINIVILKSLMGYHASLRTAYLRRFNV